MLPLCRMENDKNAIYKPSMQTYALQTYYSSQVYKFIHLCCIKLPHDGEIKLNIEGGQKRNMWNIRVVCLDVSAHRSLSTFKTEETSLN